MEKVLNSGRNYVTGTSQALSMGEDRLQMNYEGSGVYVDDTGKGLLHDSAIYCMGSLHAIKGEYEETGFMVFNPPDGDKAYATYKATGKVGESAKGTYTWTGGTGKYTGLKGGGEFTRYQLNNATEQVFASVSVAKGTYTLS